MKSFFLSTHDAYLRYHELPGKLPARVYLHCLGGAGDLYLRTAQSPLLSGRALLVDLLGFGRSDRPETFGYTLEDHARAVASLLDHLALQECDVIGHSMGGSVAVALAALRPDLVSRLALAEAPLRPGRDSASRAISMQTEAEFCRAGFDAFVEEVRSFVAREGTLADFLGALRQAAPYALYRSAVGLVQGAPEALERFLRLPLPRAYLFGDQTLQEPDQARLAEDLASCGVRVFTVPGSGHHINLDNPEGFAEALATFFAR